LPFQHRLALDSGHISYSSPAPSALKGAHTPFATKGQPYRLIVSRMRPTPANQLALFAEFTYHAFITDRVGEIVTLEADHWFEERYYRRLGETSSAA
jgi:hypothetical protein